MFGRTATATTKSKAPESESKPQRSALDRDAVVDTLGAILRSLGEHCFDLDDSDAQSTRGLFEAWAQHVLIGTPPPASPKPPAEGQRDWNALQRFVAAQRGKEVQFVTRSLSELRQIIWDVAAAFNRSAANHGVDVQPAQQQLERLRAALNAQDPAVLRREAGLVIEVVEGVFSKQSERHRAELAAFATRVRTLGAELENARREGEIDPMTRVHNRSAFDGHLARTVEFSRLFASSAVLIVTDIDHFKAINDSHGHAVGDDVIRACADRLSLTFPRKGDFVARFGGDEFGILLKDVTAADAEMLAQRLVDAVRRVKVPRGTSHVSFRISVGVALMVDGDTPATWFERADAALYRAKANGRDGFAIDRG